MRNGIFKSKDTVELGGSAAEFGEFGFSVSIATDREEEDPEDRVTVLSVANRQGRGVWRHPMVPLYAPGQFNLDEFDLIYDPYMKTPIRRALVKPRSRQDKLGTHSTHCRSFIIK